MAAGRVSSREAWTLFAVLVGLSFVLVLLTNATTVYLSFARLRWPPATRS